MGRRALAVQVGHDADAALVAPFSGVACAHTHDSEIVCCIPRLRCRLPKQSPYARGLSRAEVIATTLMSKSAITYQLGLKQRRDASLDGSFRVSLRQARCPWGHLALCSVRSSRIARCRDATRSSRACRRCRSACGRAHHLPGPDVYHLTCRMSCTHLRFSNQTLKSSIRP